LLLFVPVLLLGQVQIALEPLVLEIVMEMVFAMCKQELVIVLQTLALFNICLPSVLSAPTVLLPTLVPHWELQIVSLALKKLRPEI
jgi:hypothetical protein